MKKITALLFLFFACTALFAQVEEQKGLEAITIESIKGQLGFLASDWTEGRAVGTKGAYMAADYIAAMFQTYGVKPFGDQVYSRPTRAELMAGIRPTASKSYFQNFSLIEYEPGDEQQLSVISGKTGSESSIEFNFKTDFYVNTGSVGQSGKGGLVFIGYGFQDEEKGYDDLKKVDLNGKIAVVLSGFPGHRDSASVAFKKFVPKDRYAVSRIRGRKYENLEKAGAIAIIRVRLDIDPTQTWASNQIYPVKGNYYEADQALNNYYSTRMMMPGKEVGVSLPVFSVTQRVANAIIAGTNVDFEKFEKEVAANPVPKSVELSGKSIAFKTTVKSKIVKARNVVGFIEGEKKDEFIVVGGHYDHLGKHDGWIWNGADDNASGTVGVMTLAKAFMATGKKPERSVIFAAWTAEERGLYGSKYFVEKAKENDMNVVLNLNYDMIGRDAESDSAKNKAGMSYTKANYRIEETTKQFIEEYKLNLDVSYRASDRPRGGSDHAPFAAENIPVFYFMAAMHPDYHQPSDELNNINWEKMLNIIKIGFLNTWQFANSDDWMKTDAEAEK